jgi:hypothetical protein
MKNSLYGRTVKISANDFVLQDISAHVMLADEMDKKILLELDTALNVAGVFYRYAIASPRLAKNNLVDLLDTGVLGSAVTWIPDTKFDVNRPLDVSWWRGGAAAVTDIVLIREDAPSASE